MPLGSRHPRLRPAALVDLGGAQQDVALALGEALLAGAIHFGKDGVKLCFEMFIDGRLDGGGRSGRHWFGYGVLAAVDAELGPSSHAPRA